MEQPVSSHQVLDEDPLGVARDHSDKPLGKEEYARIWRHRSLNGVELFRGSYRTYGFSRHYHSVPAIGVVDRGAMTSYCRRAHHIAPAGTVILLNAGDVHAPKAASSGGWSFRTFFLDEGLFRKSSLALGADVLRFRRPFVQDRGIAAGLLRLHRKLEHSGTSLELESALLTVLAQIAERHVGPPGSGHCNGIEPLKIRRVREYIGAHYAQELSLDNLARVAEFSPYHLLRAFRDAVGLTPHAYLIQMRIEAAKRLMLGGTPLAAVAARTGFADQSHFNRHFKRIVGVTPGQYHPETRR